MTPVTVGGGSQGCRKVAPPLTEHALQPDEAADEAVEVDVHVLVCIPHGDDVVELAVEVESCRGQHVRGGRRLSPSACILLALPLSRSVAWEGDEKHFLLWLVGP